MKSKEYDLAKPTEAHLAASLQKVMGAAKAEAILAEARGACGDEDLADPLLYLTKLVMWLSRQKGLASVVGKSMSIRIKFYNSI